MNRCCGNQKMYAMPTEVAQQPCPEMMPHHCGPQQMNQMPVNEMPMPEVPVQHHYQGTVTQVVEPTVYCPNETHTYNKVEHIIPVIVTNVHHVHTEHEYIVCKEEKTEVCEHTYGLECEKNVCEMVNHCHHDSKWY